MTRKTFAQLMNETFLTGDVPDTTATAASAASAEPAPPLTLDTLLEVRRRLHAELPTPVIYYFASERLEDRTAVYKLPNDQARCGYDLAFHPDMLSVVSAALSGQCILRPMDNAEEKRRADLTAEMLRIGANWLASQ